MDYFERARTADSALLAALALGVIGVFALCLLGHLNQEEDGQVEKGCGIQGLRSRIASLRASSKRFIAVVGDGVGGEISVMERPYNTQFAQGYDLFQGVQHALRIPGLKGTLDDVDVLYVDDGGNSPCAARIAEVLAAQPGLTGIIGHSTTSCTMAALPAYKRSNIPVIIPAATNPALLQKNSDHCFRLPSNDKVQSVVIADLIRSKLKAKAVFVVWDATPEASQYAEFLKTSIQHYMNAGAQAGVPILEGSYPISLNPLNYTYLFRRIVSSEVDVVVFAGYGSLAREFLLGLDQEYEAHQELKRPKVILTDGCKIPRITGYSFDAYLTFAAAPLASFPSFSGFNPGHPSDQFQQMYLEESFEVFGYDATVLMLGAIESIRQTKHNVSRLEIVRAIDRGAGHLSTSYEYKFEAGENVDHRYYCYSLRDSKIAHEYDSSAVNALLREMEGQ